MKSWVLFAWVTFSLVWLSACGTEPGPPAVKLAGRAVLPADTFVPGPPVGRELAGEINGRTLPLKSLPVQGFSSLIPLGDDQYLALQDNGFGTQANSPDYPLGWFRIQIRFGRSEGETGEVEVLQTVHLSDPDGFFPYPLQQPGKGRWFTGADLDPESFVQLADGTLWVGEEFGPWLLHFSAEGELLGPPVEIPIPEAMLFVNRNYRVLQSPDHPEKFVASVDVTSLPRSGGLEGLALSADGEFLLVAVEKGLLKDPQKRRRLIMEYDLQQAGFTTHYYYQTDADNISLAALETCGPGGLLVTERDEGQGETAVIKRIYRVQLEAADDEGYLAKELVCDLMHIRDEAGLTANETGALGLGARFTFPFVTPEVLVLVDEKTLLVANDNNYPLSSGRRPPNIPDDTEFILLELP